MKYTAPSAQDSSLPDSTAAQKKKKKKKKKINDITAVVLLR